MRRYRYFDFDTNTYERNVEILDQNGSLRYVEFEDGRKDWVSANELDETED